MSDHDTPDTSSTEIKSFPLKAKVLLHGLKSEEFNGKVGIILGGLKDGRQQVHVEELDKNAALKLVNLSYQQRELDSLSVKELKKILQHKEAVLKFQGMDKSDLQAKLKALTTSPLEIAEWLAHANAPSSASSTAAATASNSSGTTATTNNNEFQAGLEQFENMDPNQLRQQAQMMRNMPAATLRSMNPQLAGMSDAQIQQAASQMEMMASNPQMMQRMRDQMKNMTPAQMAQYQQMMGGSGGAASAGMGGAGAPGSPPPAQQNPQEMLANMSPEQLQQQAQMMRSMPPSQIRSMNPQLAHMSDEQIKAAASQMEMMASNPELMKMAREQMKGLSPEEMQNMMKGSAGAGANSSNNFNPMTMPGAGSGNANGSDGGMPTSMDPSKLLETMEPKQIKEMMNMLKSNPEMLQNLAAQTGMPKEGLEKAISMFGDMSEDQLETSLKTMAKVQKVSAGFQSVWAKANGVAGGHLKKILIAGGIILFGMMLMYWLGGEDGTPDASILNAKESDAVPPPPEMAAKETVEDEFDEF